MSAQCSPYNQCWNCPLSCSFAQSRSAVMERDYMNTVEQIRRDKLKAELNKQC